MTDTTTAETGAATGGVRTLLRLEGLVLFVGMTVLYYKWEGSWLVYVLLFLVPDLSFAAYLISSRVGAVAYNAAHTYLAPVALMTLGFAGEGPLVLSIAMIWRPRARLWAEIFQRLWLHPSRANRESTGAGLGVMPFASAKTAARPGKLTAYAAIAVVADNQDNIRGYRC